MKVDKKLDDCYRVLIPIEIRNKLDINKYEPLVLEFNEETKEITINFNKYKDMKVESTKQEETIDSKDLDNEGFIDGTLQIRKRSILTIPKEVFNELDLYYKRYNVTYLTRFNKSILTFTLSENGTYKYRKENVISFPEISKSLGIDIKEGTYCDFTYKSDGTLIFEFSSSDIIKKDSDHKEISTNERFRNACS